MNANSFIVTIKTEEIYWDIPNDVETRFGKSSYKNDRKK